MNFLWSLFTLRRKHRHYVLLDNFGLCVAFRHCSTPPCGAGWVQTHDVCLSWLQRPLPDKARVIARDSGGRSQAALAN
jgi:hypothetical protein